MHILIIVGIFVLVLALITASLILGMKKMAQKSQWEYELRRDGVTVQGHIIGRHEEVIQSRYGKSTYYMVKYSYLYDGVSHEREAEMLESDYRSHLTLTGTEISVICHPRHPEVAHLLINGRLGGSIAY